MDERNAEKPMEYKDEKPVEMNVPMREKTLNEYVAELPDGHWARREYSELTRPDEKKVVSRRTQRIAVASRVLAAALLVRELAWKIDRATQGPWSKEQAVKDSVELADALLARIDETEAGR